jgi:hypothetical protein
VTRSTSNCPSLRIVHSNRCEGVKVTFREVVGLVLCGVAVALIPIGLYASRGLWLVAVLLFVVGAVLLITERVAKNQKELENLPSNEPVRPTTPGDIHNYSGWRSGGRRNELESESGGGDDAAD